MTTTYDGTEDVIKTYSPSSGLHDVNSVLRGIDKIEGSSRNKYLSDSEMALLTDDKVIKLAYWKRIFVFQLILNFIEEAVAIVSVDAQIDKIIWELHPHDESVPKGT